MQTMLTEVCQNLKNWFVHEQFIGQIKIEDGTIYADGEPVNIKQNQFYRIIGSVFSDGVWKFDGQDTPQDEEFDGAIWTMAVSAALVSLIEEMKEWQDIHGKADSEAMSPFQSEHFGDYSYTKASGSGSDSGSAPSALSVYKKRLDMWRKI